MELYENAAGALTVHGRLDIFENLNECVMIIEMG